MNEAIVLQRKESVLSVLRNNEKAKSFNIEVVPINGSGDMKFRLERISKYKHKQVKWGVVQFSEDLSSLADLFYTE